MAGELFQFKFDGELVQEPEGWREAQITIERNKLLRGLLFEYTNELTFYGDAYNILLDKLNNNLCSSINVDILRRCQGGSFELFFEGEIKLSEEVTFFPDKCKATAQIKDRTYNSKIRNNRKIEARASVGKSKDGTEITEASSIDLKFHDIATGNYSTPARKAWRVHDVFDFLVRFMSNGSLSFKSDFLDQGTSRDSGYNYNFAVISGRGIRDNNFAEAPFVTFEKLFEFFKKTHDLAFRIEGSTLRVEPLSTFFDEANALEFDNVPDVEMKVNNDKFYAGIDVGSDDYSDDDGTFNTIRYKTFKTESYHIQTDCNRDEILDLQPPYLYDSNNIEKSFGGDDGNDDSPFIIEYFHDTNNNEYKTVSDPISEFNNNFFYNLHLTNEFIIKNNSGNIPANAVVFDNENESEFQAVISDPGSSPVSAFSITNSATSQLNAPPLDKTETEMFDNDSRGNLDPEGFDPGSNYNTSSYFYTAPADGIYKFKTKATFEQVNYVIELDSSNPNSDLITREQIRKSINGVDVRVKIIIKESGGSVDNTYSSGIVRIGIKGQILFQNQIGYVYSYFNTETQTIDVETDALSLLSGQTAEVQIDHAAPRVSGIAATVKEATCNHGLIHQDGSGFDGSFFKTEFTDIGGGVFEEFTTDGVLTLQYDFEYDMGFDRFAKLRANTNQRIAFANNYIKDQAWIDKIDFEVLTGKADISIIK